MRKPVNRKLTAHELRCHLKYLMNGEDFSPLLTFNWFLLYIEIIIERS